MGTKERIIEEALKLFSRKGYYAVSVRDIAGAVGIKESSLYNHFKNKQDIFDTIFNTCFQHAESYFREQSIPFDFSDDISIYSDMEFDTLLNMILKTFGYFFDDENNVMFRKLLMLSQYDNEEARLIYRHLYRDYPLKFQRNVFAGLIKTGEFKQDDPMTLATDFYGVVFMLIHTCDSLAEATPQISAHLKHFVENHKSN